MLTAYFYCLALSLVAANPVLQRIPIPIPGQTCPAPCPTCPNTSRPACQTCQNPYRNVYNPLPAVVQQPSNNCPCNMPQTVQNTIANQPVNQEALTQLVLRRLLNPQPHVNPPPARVCSQCEATKPSIINNYIIIPPEYFKANETKVRDEETVSKKRKNKRRRQQRQRNQQNDSVCSCDDKNENRQDKIFNKDVTPCPCDIENSPEAVAEVGDSNTKYISKPRHEIAKDEILTETMTANAQNTGISGREKIKENYQEIVPSKAAYTDPNPVETNKPKRRNRERTKNLEEAIIRDFCKRNPTIPEEIARLLLKNLKQQVENQGSLPYSPYPFSTFGNSGYYPPMFYPQNEVKSHRVSVSERDSRRRKPHRSGRRNKKPKQGITENTDCDEKCEKIVAVNPRVINIETETITTEKIIATTERKVKDNVPINKSETQKETPDDLIDHLEKLKGKFAQLNEIETTTVSYNKHISPYPELGKEDKVPTVYDNGVDDYYPDFRGDNIAFYASDEELDVKDRYHYTTDRNGGFDCKRYVEHDINNQNHDINKDENSSEYTLPIPTESYESYEESVKDESEEVRFRIPPHLELPDFETKQINKLTQEIKAAFVPDDVNADIELKPAKIFTKDRTGRTNIETVFGHSRVVKYGQDTDEAASDPVITYYLPEEAMTEDRIQLPDSDKAVVVAKSIQDLVDSWE